MENNNPYQTLEEILKTETFIDIEGFNGAYKISQSGRVLSLRKFKPPIFLKHQNNHGYRSVSLHDPEGKNVTRFVHVLIGRAFIPNPFNKNQINHINGIKSDNRIDNLEWCTQFENMRHAREMGLINHDHFKKQVINTKTGEIFNSITEAAQSIDMQPVCLGKKLNGLRINKTDFIYLRNENE